MKQFGNKSIFGFNQKIKVLVMYSSVPNRRAVRNKRAGGKILKKTLNVQGRIDVQGGKST